MGCCIQPSQCRVRFVPSLLLFFAAVALLLSLLSSLDCQFLTLIVPVAQEAEGIGNGPQTIGVGLGLWTFEVPSVFLDGPDDEYANAPGKRMCASYSAARSIGGLATSSGFLPYYEPFGNTDRPWTLSRVFAVLGMISGAVGCVVLVMILAKRKRRRKQSKILIAQATTSAFLAESIKLGLFFNNYYCMSTTAWLLSGDEEKDEVGSAECDLDRGSVASLLSLLSYLGVSVAILLHLSRPPNARHKIKYDRDEASIPSFLHSVGISVENSKYSDGMSKNVGSSSGGIAASEHFVDRRQYFRMQKHKPQLQAVAESSRVPSLPARPPPKKIALTTDQSIYTNALSSVGMGTAGLDGHSLAPGPNSHSTRHGIHSSVVAASTAPTRIQCMEEKYRLSNKSSRHLGSKSTSRHRKSGESDQHLHVHRSSNSSSRRLHYAPSSSRMIDRGDLGFQDLEGPAPRRQRSLRSLGGGTSVGMGTVGHQGAAGSSSAPRRERSLRSLGAGTSVGMGTVGHHGPAGSGLPHFGVRG